MRCDISTSCVLNVCKANGYCIVSKCSIETKKELKDFVEGKNNMLKIIGYTSDSVNPDNLPIRPILKKPKNQLKPKSEKWKHRRKKIWESAKGICYLCNNPVSLQSFTIDHVVPKSKGGKSNLGNLKPTHSKCNGLKGNKIL